MVRKDLRDVEVGEHKWYEEATSSRVSWRAMYRVGLENCREMRTAQAQAPVVARDVFVKYAPEDLGGRVTRRGINV